MTCVRGSSRYSEKEILDSLSKNVRTLEGEIKSTKEDLDNCKKHKIDVENENNRIKNETKKIKLENEKLRDQSNKHKIERNRLNAQIRQFTLDNQKLKGLINSGKGFAREFVEKTKIKTTLDQSFKIALVREFNLYSYRNIV